MGAGLSKGTRLMLSNMIMLRADLKRLKENIEKDGKTSNNAKLMFNIGGRMVSMSNIIGEHVDDMQSDLGSSEWAYNKYRELDIDITSLDLDVKLLANDWSK